jgi:hypothetical protein
VLSSSGEAKSQETANVDAPVIPFPYRSNISLRFHQREFSIKIIFQIIKM